MLWKPGEGGGGGEGEAVGVLERGRDANEGYDVEWGMGTRDYRFFFIYLVDNLAYLA